jgi:hypothetical protein
MPANFVVENGAKNTGRIKPGKTAPVDGPIDPNQGHGMQIANNPVITNIFITHETPAE